MTTYFPLLGVNKLTPRPLVCQWHEILNEYLVQTQGPSKTIIRAYVNSLMCIAKYYGKCSRLIVKLQFCETEDFISIMDPVKTFV